MPEPRKYSDELRDRATRMAMGGAAGPGHEYRRDQADR